MIRRGRLCRPLRGLDDLLVLRTWGSATLHPRLYAVAGSAGLLSELKLNCELDGAWPADLVERVETATRTSSPETIRQRLCRAAKQRVVQGVNRVAEIRMVEDVEELGAETKSHFFG